jgi:hypothetical protein|tara:strand:- start:553 stop:978 length:426 start_codon:yes stop_codon:yes gene_type:complete
MGNYFGFNNVESLRKALDGREVVFECGTMIPKKLMKYYNDTFSGGKRYTVIWGRFIHDDFNTKNYTGKMIINDSYDSIRPVKSLYEKSRINNWVYIKSNFEKILSLKSIRINYKNINSIIYANLNKPNRIKVGICSPTKIL